MDDTDRAPHEVVADHPYDGDWDKWYLDMEQWHQIPSCQECGICINPREIANNKDFRGFCTSCSKK